MSRSLARGIAAVARALTRAQKPNRARVTQALASEALIPRVTVATAAGPILLDCPTSRSLHDPHGFGRDEPETVAWIMSLPEGTVLWDIGANIGLYALLAARRGLRVLAFEPSAASFAALMRNIEINGFGDRVSVFCVALDERTHLATLSMAATGAGHSMHSLDGGSAVAFRQTIPAFAMDDIARAFGLPLPDAIKLDVDGIEPAILRGGGQALAHAREVLVEVEGTNEDAVPPLLAGLGFRQEPGTGRNRVFRR
ncbi:MAG: FkbM family methyltransferase [Acetobacteraceae bacterium]|nr:FkbM family methyltransferase [Acetobacteraceae bacterium]